MNEIIGCFQEVLIVDEESGMVCLEFPKIDYAVLFEKSEAEKILVQLQAVLAKIPDERAKVLPKAPGTTEDA